VLVRLPRDDPPTGQPLPAVRVQADLASAALRHTGAELGRLGPVLGRSSFVVNVTHLATAQL
jgi:hypothetical protein